MHALIGIAKISFIKTAHVHINIACVCRLKEASNKKKKLFHPKSSGQKEELKYYDMLIRNTEALIKGSLLDLPPH